MRELTVMTGAREPLPSPLPTALTVTSAKVNPATLFGQKRLALLIRYTEEYVLCKPREHHLDVFVKPFLVNSRS